MVDSSNREIICCYMVPPPLRPGGALLRGVKRSSSAMAEEGLVSLEACHSYCPCRDAFSSEHRHGDFSCAGDLTRQVDGPRIWLWRLWVKTRIPGISNQLAHGYSSPPRYGIGFKLHVAHMSLPCCRVMTCKGRNRQSAVVWRFPSK